MRAISPHVLGQLAATLRRPTRGSPRGTTDLPTSPVAGCHVELGLDDGDELCGSLEELARIIESPAAARVAIVRLGSSSFVPSSGMDVSEPWRFVRVAELLSQFPRDLELGVLHRLGAAAAGRTPFDAIETILGWAAALERVAGRPVKTFALGGRFHLGDIARLDLRRLIAVVRDRLPQVERLLLVPSPSQTPSGR